MPWWPLNSLPPKGGIHVCWADYSKLRVPDDGFGSTPTFPQVRLDFEYFPSGLKWGLGKNLSSFIKICDIDPTVFLKCSWKFTIFNTLLMVQYTMNFSVFMVIHGFSWKFMAFLKILCHRIWQLFMESHGFLHYWSNPFWKD